MDAIARIKTIREGIIALTPAFTPVSDDPLVELAALEREVATLQGVVAKEEAAVLQYAASLGWMDRYGSIDPMTYRYSHQLVSDYLSANAEIGYQAMVEFAILLEAAARGMIPANNLLEKAWEPMAGIKAKPVYDEENKTKHDIVALVNVIKARVPPEYQDFVHWLATSYDIIETSRALMYKHFTFEVMSEHSRLLAGLMADLAVREAETRQVGRTHGQHASPITLGFALANYLSRMTQGILKIEETARNLRGKFSGAVGTHNVATLFVDDPLELERSVLTRLGLEPAPISSQIVPPEYMKEHLTAYIDFSVGVMAQIGRDFRHLQRTEIGEIGEPFKAGQKGSSAMPHKRNPINFENLESLSRLAKALQTLLSDNLVSEHQRDLANSACTRFYTMIPAIAYEQIDRLIRTISEKDKATGERTLKIEVNRKALAANLGLTQGAVGSEAAQNLLRGKVPDSHSIIQELAFLAAERGTTLQQEIAFDPRTVSALDSLSQDEQDIILYPERNFVGVAPEETLAVVVSCREQLGI